MDLLLELLLPLLLVLVFILLLRLYVIRKQVLVSLEPQQRCQRQERNVVPTMAATKSLL